MTELQIQQQIKSNILKKIGTNMHLNTYNYTKPNTEKYSLNFNIAELKQKYIDKLNNQLYTLNFEMVSLDELYNELTNRITIYKLKHKYTFKIFDKTYYNILQQLEIVDKKIILLEDCITQVKQQLSNIT